jgi:hypothetical protein
MKCDVLGGVNSGVTESMTGIHGMKSVEQNRQTGVLARSASEIEVNQKFPEAAQHRIRERT